MKRLWWWVERQMMLVGIYLAVWVPPLRPLKFLIADHMLLACGYRDQQGTTKVIYRLGRHSHTPIVEAKENGRWHLASDATLLTTNGQIMQEAALAHQSRTTRVRAKRAFWHVRSKVIRQRNDATVFDKSAFHVRHDDTITFTWENPTDRRYWFSFLTVEDSSGHLFAGLYTRAGRWQYGELAKLPYYIQRPARQSLVRGQRYRAVLYHVNVDNWVTHVDRITFDY